MTDLGRKAIYHATFRDAATGQSVPHEGDWIRGDLRAGLQLASLHVCRREEELTCDFRRKSKPTYLCHYEIFISNIVCVNYSRETISNRKDDKHRNRFDLSTSHFSPDGRVFQIEYAGQAVENSGTAVASRGKDGVVFAV